MSDYLTFSNIRSDTYGLLLLSDEIAGAEPDYTMISVPGRNGDLHQSNHRYKNRERRLVVYCPEDAKEDLEEFIAYLLSIDGYARLESTIWPDFYMTARFKGRATPKKSVGYVAGRVELVFDCKPQKWLLSGEEAVSVADSTSGTVQAAFQNPTRYNAKPLINFSVDGVGAYILVPDYTVQYKIQYLPDDTFISGVVLDCENEQIRGRYSNTSLEHYFELTPNHQFPFLGTGGRGITFYGMKNVTVTPRWWTL